MRNNNKKTYFQRTVCPSFSRYFQNQRFMQQNWQE